MVVTLQEVFEVLSGPFSKMRAANATAWNIAKQCKVVRYNTRMRMSRTLSITLPPEMLSRAEQLAHRESRTMSELVREALRHYERKIWWEDTNAYGRARAEKLSLTEADVVPLVKQVRKERRAPRNSRRPAK
jgi:predicted transcriptional regulator